MSIKSDINLNKNDEEVLLERYISEISAYSPLDDAEEARLSELIKRGDAKAQDRLVKANLKFVVSIARQYVADGVSMLDLIDEGNIALINAATKFDAKRGQRFSNYAVWEIRRAIEAFLPNDDIRMNRTVSEHIPSDGADADEGLSEAEIELLRERLPLLPEREQRVLQAYFGVDEEPLTMAEIGEKLGLKRERVRQIRNRAIRRLHSYRNI